MNEKCDNCANEYDDGYDAGYEQADKESQAELTKEQVESERLNEEIDRLKGLLVYIAGITQDA